MLRLRARLRGRLPAHLRALRDRHYARAHELLLDFSAECEAAEEPWEEPVAEGSAHEFWQLSLPAGRRLKRQPDDVLVSVFVTALIAGGYATELVLQSLERRRLPFTHSDVELVLRAALDREGQHHFVPTLAHAVAAAERLAETGELATVWPLLDQAKRAVERTQEWDTFPSERTRLRTMLHRLLAVEGELDLGIFEQDDDWGRRMCAKLGPRFAALPGINDVLMHFADATRAPPSASWRCTTAELVASTPAFDELVLAMLEELPAAKAAVQGATGEVEGEPGGLNRLILEAANEGRWFLGGVAYDTPFLTDANSTLVRGAVWSLLDLDVPWRLDLLRRLLEAALDDGYRPPHACMYVLGELGDRQALALLSEVRAKVKQRSTLTQVDQTLALAAHRWGMTASQLRETLLEDFDLAADGHKTLTIGTASAVVQVEDAHRVAVTWRDSGGKSSRSAPEEIRRAFVAELRALDRHIEVIRNTLAAERTRIENLFVEDRRWTFEEWRERYLRHPLLRCFGCALIWTFRADDREFAAVPVDGATLVGLDGRPPAIARDADVRLWHPIDAAPDEVAAWRSFLLERRLAQPFQQADRELYLLTPAELEHTHSSRFGGQIVRYAQAYELMQLRGWSFEPLGPFPMGGRSWRDFEAHGIRAEFWMERDEDMLETDADIGHATTDQVWFTRNGKDEPISLAEVPAIVFTEAMRDVDRFVHAAWVEADPTWEDPGGFRRDGHWEDPSFGELGKRGQRRRGVLEELVPQLRIADRCAIEGPFLVVRGDVRTYKIDIGTAEVLMEPDDEYLCVGPEWAEAQATDVLLPFESDRRLSVILSLAFLLAEDRRIRDRTIRGQIRRR